MLLTLAAIAAHHIYGPLAWEETPLPRRFATSESESELCCLVEVLMLAKKELVADLCCLELRHEGEPAT